MKSENQIIARWKQPLKIENHYSVCFPFLSLGERNILQKVLLSCFSVFIFSMPSNVITIVIQFMFLGINTFWARLTAHFNSHLTARAKMILGWAQNIFMPANMNYIVLLPVCIGCSYCSTPVLFGKTHKELLALATLPRKPVELLLLHECFQL